MLFGSNDDLVYHVRKQTRELARELLLHHVHVVFVRNDLGREDILRLEGLRQPPVLPVTTGTCLSAIVRYTRERERTSWAPSGPESSASPRFRSSSTMLRPETMTIHLSNVAILNADSGYCVDGEHPVSKNAASEDAVRERDVPSCIPPQARPCSRPACGKHRGKTIQEGRTRRQWGSRVAVGSAQWLLRPATMVNHEGMGCLRDRCTIARRRRQ